MAAKSEIESFFAGKSIFITGGTGFVGRALIEKLLRSCPDIGTIYLLIREKAGVDSQVRVNEMLKSDCFDNVRDELSRSPIPAVAGDITKPNFGLSELDLKVLQDNVSVVFHIAATVKFNEKLKRAVQSNVIGTKTVLELCAGMKKLEALVHVSTAYSNCTETELVEEKIYPPAISAEELMELVSKLDEDQVELLSPSLVGRFPNTYTFTKHIAESLVAQYSGKFPIAIVRPSIICAGWKEPKPGWIGALHGSTSVIALGSMGFVYFFYLKDYNTVGDMIPVDICANTLILVAWNRAKIGKHQGTVSVYNCASGPINSISWGDWASYTNRYIAKYEILGVSFPRIAPVLHELWQKVLIVMFEIMPAWILDFYSTMTGEKARYRKLMTKMCQAKEAFKYFTSSQWNFEMKNMKALDENLSPSDRERFCVKIDELQWDSYIRDNVYGVEQYLLKNYKGASTSKSQKARQSPATLAIVIGIVALCLYIFNFYATSKL